MQTKTASNDLMRLTLEKLGAAWYIHKAKINASNDAAKAVDYLKSKGVLR